MKKRKVVSAYNEAARIPIIRFFMAFTCVHYWNLSDMLFYPIVTVMVLMFIANVIMALNQEQVDIFKDSL